MQLARDKRIRVLGIGFVSRTARGLHRPLRRVFAAVGADTAGRASIDFEGVYGGARAFVIDRAGRIAYKLVGPISADNLRRGAEAATRRRWRALARTAHGSFRIHRRRADRVHDRDALARTTDASAARRKPPTRSATSPSTSRAARPSPATALRKGLKSRTRSTGAMCFAPASTLRSASPSTTRRHSKPCPPTHPSPWTAEFIYVEEAAPAMQRCSKRPRTAPSRSRPNKWRRPATRRSRNAHFDGWRVRGASGVIEVPEGATPGYNRRGRPSSSTPTRTAMSGASELFGLGGGPRLGLLTRAAAGFSLRAGA